MRKKKKVRNISRKKKTWNQNPIVTKKLPFSFSPTNTNVKFHNYQIEERYVKTIHFLNNSRAPSKLKVIPPNSPHFSVIPSTGNRERSERTLRGSMGSRSDFEPLSESVKKITDIGKTIPGKKVYFEVRLHPCNNHYCDLYDNVSFVDDLGNIFEVELEATLDYPALSLDSKITLDGPIPLNDVKNFIVEVTNVGTCEGEFIISKKMDFELVKGIDGEGGSLNESIQFDNFSIHPPRFFLEKDQKLRLRVCFKPTLNISDEEEKESNSTQSNSIFSFCEEFFILQPKYRKVDTFEIEGTACHPLIVQTKFCSYRRSSNNLTSHSLEYLENGDKKFLDEDLQEDDDFQIPNVIHFGNVLPFEKKKVTVRYKNYSDVKVPFSWHRKMTVSEKRYTTRLIENNESMSLTKSTLNNSMELENEYFVSITPKAGIFQPGEEIDFEVLFYPPTFWAKDTASSGGRAEHVSDDEEGDEGGDPFEGESPFFRRSKHSYHHEDDDIVRVRSLLFLQLDELPLPKNDKHPHFRNTFVEVPRVMEKYLHPLPSNLDQFYYFRKGSYTNDELGKSSKPFSFLQQQQQLPTCDNFIMSPTRNKRVSSGGGSGRLISRQTSDDGDEWNVDEGEEDGKQGIRRIRKKKKKKKAISNQLSSLINRKNVVGTPSVRTEESPQKSFILEYIPVYGFVRKAKLMLEPSTVYFFSPITVNETVTREFAIVNPTNTSIRYDMGESHRTSDFEIRFDPPSGTLPPQSRSPISLFFTPFAAPGSIQAGLECGMDTTNEPLYFHVVARDVVGPKILVVSPPGSPTVDLGIIEIGVEATAFFTIRNESQQEVHIDVQFANSIEEHDLAYDFEPSQFSLPSYGSTQTVEVMMTFRGPPTYFEVPICLCVENGEVVKVNCVAEIQKPRLVCHPWEMDFGSIEEGQLKIKQLKIWNLTALEIPFFVHDELLACRREGYDLRLSAEEGRILPNGEVVIDVGVRPRRTRKFEVVLPIFYSNRKTTNAYEEEEKMMMRMMMMEEEKKNDKNKDQNDEDGGVEQQKSGGLQMQEDGEARGMKEFLMSSDGGGGGGQYGVRNTLNDGVLLSVSQKYKHVTGVKIRFKTKRSTRGQKIKTTDLARMIVEDCITSVIIRESDKN